MSICGTDPLNRASDKVSNAFRLLGSGEHRQRYRHRQQGVESQMPFGFWVLGNHQTRLKPFEPPDASQMPFGFWVLGNTQQHDKYIHTIDVSNAFRLLGSGERLFFDVPRFVSLLSQMPFGFWVLGNLNPKDEAPVATVASQMPFGFWVMGNTSCRPEGTKSKG